ncbi:MAG: hypothetical protein ACR2JM_16480, partial [Mycobacterium sp.]
WRSCWPSPPVPSTTTAATEPVSAPVSEAPTTRFSAAKHDERDIGSWLGELRRKTTRRAPEADQAAEPTHVLHPGAGADDATTAIPTVSYRAAESAPATEQISAEETRAIPVSRPESVDSEVATEQLNARGTKGGGVSAQDLLRREGRL